ncbi:hypothetical protein H0178_40175 [Cytobacillus firmus]|nr:hypothetical protein [Cytobacillus firmus]
MFTSTRNLSSRWRLACSNQFIGYYTAQWEVLMAAATMVLVPPIMLFMLGQKYFIKGIAVSGLKD